MSVAFFLLGSLAVLESTHSSEVNILLRLTCLCNLCNIRKVVANLVTSYLTNSDFLVNFRMVFKAIEWLLTGANQGTLSINIFFLAAAEVTSADDDNHWRRHTLPEKTEKANKNITEQRCRRRQNSSDTENSNGEDRTIIENLGERKGRRTKRKMHGCDRRDIGIVLRTAAIAAITPTTQNCTATPTLSWLAICMDMLVAGSNKEWKPKPTYMTNQGSGPTGASEAPVSVDTTGQLQSASSALDSEEATSKLQKKLEDFHLPQRQHVILPNHIIVPDSEKNKFSFGSLGVTFGVNTSYVSGPESEKSSTPVSETSQTIEETVEEQDSSQNAAVTSEGGDYPDHPQSPTNGAENLSSSEVDGSSSAIQEYNESKQDSALPSGGHQYSGVLTSPNYSFGFVPPMLGTQLTPFDNSESQTRDASRLQSFIVHQQLDPTSYYAQFYRPGADSDGRLSPFSSAGANTKYNGNVTVLPAPSSQSPQEGGVLSTAGPTPLVTQAAGLMQSSIAVTQQPVPVFRPSGVHISHYPPNYIPYAPYFSPFYVSPPAIHQFLGNGAFPQQPQASTVYPPPPAVAATGMKYPLPQFKPGANGANPTHLVMPSAYGVYGSSAAGYNHNSAAAAGNSTSNEDLGSSQFKESNVYISGQQSEGSAVWVAAPGRDMTNLPTSTFYNLPPQGQHVTFAPTQAGHGTFAGIYHPAQAVTAATVHPLLQQSQTMAGAVDMVGPGGNVYQQPQHAQINWPSNY
ncbi:GBF-interacting protein 1, partial [Mucuna pruriens]